MFGLKDLIIKVLIALALGGLAVCGRVDAGPSITKMPGIKLDDASLQDLSFATIRVRVFPHKRDFPPHRRDVNRTRIRLESAAPCQVYEAHPHLPRKGTRFLTRTKVLPLSFRSLKTAIWIECPEPVKVVRAKGLPSYEYDGAMYVRRSYDWKTKKPQLVAINVIGIESYLTGVVPAEVHASWHEQALKSQAVAARTYAIFHMSYARKFSRHPSFDVDDSVVFQAYTGVSQRNVRTTRAVEQTAGQILMHQDNVIQAYYHSDSGGRTASARHAFNLDAPYCRAKKERYNLALIPSRWRRVVPAYELSRKLRQRRLIPRARRVASLSVPSAKRSQSGRVQAVDVLLDDGQRKRVSIRDLKRTIALNSSLFSVTSSKQAFVFNGRGSGHGVGMNQRGAKVLAKTYGWTYKKILNFYYSDTHLCVVNHETLPGGVPSCQEKAKLWTGL